MKFSTLPVPVTVAVNGRRWWHVTFGVKLNPSDGWWRWRLRARVLVLAVKVAEALARLVRLRLDVEVTVG